MTHLSGSRSGRFDIGFGTQLPDQAVMETGKVPISAYTSQERFEFEREIFGSIWLNMGRVEEVPNAGDWIVREVDCRSVSMIIIRGKDLKVRAFHNICSHRGMKLVWDKKGRGGKLACPYHAWVYDAGGELVNVPDEECFPHVDKGASGLTPIHCDVWEGFIFINLDAHPKQTLLEYLGPVADRLKGAPFHDYMLNFTISQEIDANWKLGLEAGSEAYHVQALHKNTVRDVLCSTDNPFVHFLTFEPLGAHRTSSVPNNPDFSLNPRKPVQNFAFSNAPQMVIKGKGRNGDFATLPGVNPSGANDWGTDKFTLFPNSAMNVALNGWYITQYWPISPSRSLWKTRYFVQMPSTLRGSFATHYSLALQRDIMTEDNLCVQQQQRAMESGAKSVIQFGEGEIFCRHLAAVWETIASDQMDARVLSA